jgi:hypothetical protein
MRIYPDFRLGVRAFFPGCAYDYDNGPAHGEYE